MNDQKGLGDLGPSELSALRAQLAEAQRELGVYKKGFNCDVIAQLQSQAAQLAGMREALRELEVIKAETHQILEATKPWVKGNPDRSHLDLFHMGCCALRSWGASMTAISALSTPASEWEKRVQGLVEACQYAHGPLGPDKADMALAAWEGKARG